MSHLKRPRPDHQDALLRKLQERSSSRMECERNEVVSPTSCLECSSSDKDLNDADENLTGTETRRTGKEMGGLGGLGGTVPVKYCHPSNISSTPSIIPDLTVTPDNHDVFTVSPTNVVSSSTPSIIPDLTVTPDNHDVFTVSPTNVMSSFTPSIIPDLTVTPDNHDVFTVSPTNVMSSFTPSIIPDLTVTPDNHDVFTVSPTNVMSSFTPSIIPDLTVTPDNHDVFTVSPTNVVSSSTPSIIPDLTVTPDNHDVFTVSPTNVMSSFTPSIIPDLTVTPDNHDVFTVSPTNVVSSSTPSIIPDLTVTPDNHDVFTVSPTNVVSSSTPSIIPDLTVTPDNHDVFTVSPTNVMSSSTPSPKVAVKNRHLVHGLYALSVSDTSDYPSSSSSPRTKILPSFYSPKLGRRFESLPDCKSASLSPTSPSRKFFRLMSSPTSFASSKRRGSEPLLDGKDLSEVQMSMTDRRWEKLRTILEAMKNEPFDPVDLALGRPTTDLTLGSLKENIDMQEELSTLRKELSALHGELELRDCKLKNAVKDRNVALAYIKKLKLADRDVEDENRNGLSEMDGYSAMESMPGVWDRKDLNTARCSVYTKEIDSLKTEAAEKGDVLNVLTRVVEELRVERSYLNHLMSVVLDRAPWMLDEVDKGGHWLDNVVVCSSDEDDDGQVWC